MALTQIATGSTMEKPIPSPTLEALKFAALRSKRTICGDD
jgi:hypothetical protein